MSYKTRLDSDTASAKSVAVKLRETARAALPEQGKIARYTVEGHCRQNIGSRVRITKRSNRTRYTVADVYTSASVPLNLMLGVTRKF